MFSCEYCQIFKNNFFIDHPWWLFLNFFTEFQKETIFSINGSVMKNFSCSFLFGFAFKMSKQCSERTKQPEKCFLSWISFLSQYIKIFCLFIQGYAKNIAFTCVNPLLFLLPFIIFFVLISFSMNFKFNFGLNLITIRIFHLKCKISFQFLPIKEESLGFLELGL